MAYQTANLNLFEILPGGLFRMWIYNAGADTQATVRLNGHMTDGVKKGMKVGDIVLVLLAANAMSMHRVVTATLGAVGANDIVDLTDGTTFAGTNTD